MFRQPMGAVMAGWKELVNKNTGFPARNVMQGARITYTGSPRHINLISNMFEYPGMSPMPQLFCAPV